MNILTKDGALTDLIWIAPKRTGTRATNKIFIENGYIPIIIGNSEPQSHGNNYTHSRIIPLEYRSLKYSIICNTRNPYTRIYAKWKRIYLYNLQNLHDYNVTSEIYTNNSNFTDSLFENFISKKTNDLNSVVLIKTPSYVTFKDYINLIIKDNKQDYIPSNYAKNIYTIKLENFTTDILNLPFIKKISEETKNNNSALTERKLFLKFHFLHNILKNNSIDLTYYKTFIEKHIFTKNFLNTCPDYIFLNNFYNQLNNITKSEQRDYIHFLNKHVITPRHYKSESILYDINNFFNNEEQPYNQELADTVFYSEMDWFTRFDYKKDSWKQFLS